MVRTKLYFASLFMALSAYASAQISLSELLKGSIATSSQPTEALCEAVSPALTILREQYRLERQGKRYGKGGRAYYGESYSLGVKISGATLLLRTALCPWESDTDYKRVNSDGKYTHEHFRTMRRLLADSVWQPAEFEYGTVHLRAASADSLLFIHEDRMSDFGLSIDTSLGTKHGYMLWAIATPSPKDSSMQVTLQKELRTYTISEDVSDISITAPDSTKVLGGVYVVPIVEQVGYIKIMLAGIALSTNDDTWLLRPMAALGSKNNEPKTAVESSKTETAEPTLAN